MTAERLCGCVSANDRKREIAERIAPTHTHADERCTYTSAHTSFCLFRFFFRVCASKLNAIDTETVSSVRLLVQIQSSVIRKFSCLPCGTQKSNDNDTSFECSLNNFKYDLNKIGSSTFDRVFVWNCFVQSKQFRKLILVLFFVIFFSSNENPKQNK